MKTLDNQIDTTTGTLKLRAEFANQDGALFPNQFVNVRLLVDQLRDTVVIPTSAVQRGAPGTFVFLVNNDNTVTVRPVALGPTNGDRVAVQSGLAAGDNVVIDGADKLRNGARVTLRAAGGGGNASSGGSQATPANPNTQNGAPANPDSGSRRRRNSQ